MGVCQSLWDWKAKKAQLTTFFTSLAEQPKYTYTAVLHCIWGRKHWTTDERCSLWSRYGDVKQNWNLIGVVGLIMSPSGAPGLLQSLFLCSNMFLCSWHSFKSKSVGLPMWFERLGPYKSSKKSLSSIFEENMPENQTDYLIFICCL